LFLIVGLGNPGRLYEANRHNVGFMAVDDLRRVESFPDYKEKFSGTWARRDMVVGSSHESVALLKPLTFMNLSGDSVQPAAAFLKVAPEDVIVVHDELDIHFGDIRIKFGGGHAGHNGLRSIVERLGSADFVRVRVGIGRPGPGFRGTVADYVLQNFDAAERAELSDVLVRVLDAIRRVLREGRGAAMNVVNAATPGSAKLPRAPSPLGPKKRPDSA
jgi:peptidyl-tRNA hydrolase, PTH1 family